MPSIQENLISYLQPQLPNVLVSEEIPDTYTGPYVWFAQSGEVVLDVMCDPQIVESQFFDVEVVSDELAVTRDLTNTVKDLLRNTGTFPAEFEGEVQNFSINDHDDSYVFKSIPDDNRTQFAALNLQANLVS